MWTKILSRNYWQHFWLTCSAKYDQGLSTCIIMVLVSLAADYLYCQDTIAVDIWSCRIYFIVYSGDMYPLHWHKLRKMLVLCHSSVNMHPYCGWVCECVRDLDMSTVGNKRERRNYFVPTKTLFVFASVCSSPNILA